MRKIEDIQIDYSKICTQAGDLGFKIKRMEREIAALGSEVRKLDLEYEEIIKNEAENTQETKAP